MQTSLTGLDCSGISETKKALYALKNKRFEMLKESYLQEEVRRIREESALIVDFLIDEIDALKKRLNALDAPLG